MNRIVFITRLTLLFFSFSLGALCVLHTPQLPSTTAGCLVYLHELEKALWKKLAKEGVQKDQCLSLKELYKSRRFEEQNESTMEIVPLSKKTITFIENIIKDFDIAPDTIQLKGTNGSGATSSDNTIYINEEKFNQISESSRRFVIGHELQHIIHQDCFLDWCIDYFLCTIDPEWKKSANSQHIYYEYSRFIEMRADILAALKGEVYANGYIEFMQFIISLKGLDEAISHPKREDRLRMALHIHNLLTNNRIDQKYSFVEDLKLEEKALWKELQSCEIKLTECQNLIDAYIREVRELTAQEHLKNGKKEVSQKTLKLVQEILNDFALDPQNINIEAFDNPDHIAGSNEITIIINEALLNKLSKNAKKFVIAHEIQHIVNRDNAIKIIIRALANTKKFDEQKMKKFNTIFLALSRFMEKRADITAALKNDSYAQGYISFAQDCLKTVGDLGGANSSHPKFSDRLQIAQNILKTIYNEESIAC